MGAAEPAGRLALVADSALVSVVEYNRLKSLGLEPSKSEAAEIRRSLATLRDGIAALERDQTRAESTPATSARDLRSQEDTLITLQQQYDKLVGLLQAGGAGDELTAPPPPPPVRTPSAYSDFDSQRSLLLGPGPRAKVAKTVRFSDNLVESEPEAPSPFNDPRNNISNSEALLLQQRIMQDQDESLDRLSESISRQRELSIQIGDELDQHVELLGEVDRLVDWGHNRLDGARQRLGKVSRKAKENSSLVTIIIVIIVLLVLLILLSCKCAPAARLTSGSIECIARRARPPVDYESTAGLIYFFGLCTSLICQPPVRT
ncbi:uncharacterized protein V1510DRAFT_364254 [Dipodascopsis tothii]|uniref:uncharacterized protein n=1 Tax=Dipodascopsis tothii TaxID=44089 RepID=UPI0034CE5139